jgi:hypothetical protein
MWAYPYIHLKREQYDEEDQVHRVWTTSFRCYVRHNPRRCCFMLTHSCSGSIASIIRMIYLDSITVPSGSFFKNNSKLAVWSTVEPGIGITVASLATLRRLFQIIFRDGKAFRLQPRLFAPTGITCMTTVTQVSNRYQETVTETRFGSEATVVATLNGNDGTALAKEKSMADEMRAYGMKDFDQCATVTTKDLNDYVDDNVERRPSVDSIPSTSTGIVTMFPGGREEKIQGKENMNNSSV